MLSVIVLLLAARIARSKESPLVPKEVKPINNNFNRTANITNITFIKKPSSNGNKRASITAAAPVTAGNINCYII